jgi:TolB protein
MDDRQPNWSPDGDRILFQRLESKNLDLYTVAVDGNDLRPLVGAPSSDTDASWSPDGMWIVFSSDYDDLPLPSIFVVRATGGDLICVTHIDAVRTAPHFGRRM